MGRARWSVGPPCWTSKLSLVSCLATSFFFSFFFSPWAPLGLEKEFPNSEIQIFAIDVGPPLGVQHMVWFFFFLSLFMLSCSPILSNFNFRLSKESERILENLKQLGWAHHGSSLGFTPESLINSFLTEILLFLAPFDLCIKNNKVNVKTNEITMN
eukprot:TRINITY_DN20786_c0_g4_i5.p1 TRINITY_DN20786_c0_g4~~TRINITY_DN20786_c0_g4_i5.p1  ORF type:complete len:156 (-),score=24.23 TRINITY_DN20786_c0_g4_i5:115-582(-)